MKLLLSFLFLIIMCLGLAQTNAFLKNGELLIGEQTELVYEFRFSSNTGIINYTPFQKSIPIKNTINGEISGEIEILKTFKDTLIKQKEFSIWRGSYTITAWDSGYFVIPETSIKLEDSTYFFQPLLVHIKFPKILKNKELYDIKEQFETIPYTLTYWLSKYGWFGVGLILLVSLILFLRNRKKNKKISSKTTKDYLEITREELEKLSAKKLWVNNETQLHYIFLSHILRTFLTQHLSINLLEKTSDETNILLKDKLNIKHLEAVSKLLAYADLIKFAKANPENETIALQHLEQVKKLVEELAKIPIHNV